MQKEQEFIHIESYSQVSLLDKLYITLFTLNELGAKPSPKLMAAIKKAENPDMYEVSESRNIERKPLEECHHLYIRDNEGNVLSGRKNKKSFDFAISLIGPERILPLGIMVKRLPLMSMKYVSKGKYNRLSSGLYIRKLADAKGMCEVLSKINAALHLEWTVELR